MYFILLLAPLPAADPRGTHELPPAARAAAAASSQGRRGGPGPVFYVWEAI